MTLTLGPATDYLFAQATAACSTVTVNGKPAVAEDGPPRLLTWGSFVVGLNSPPPDASGSTALQASIGVIGTPLMMNQAYTVPCYIDIVLGGDVTQKTVRDLAESIFNPFADGIAVDPGLGGTIPGGTARISSVGSTPLNAGTAAEPGRRQLMTFDVQITLLG